MSTYKNGKKPCCTTCTKTIPDEDDVLNWTAACQAAAKIDGGEFSSGVLDIVFIKAFCVCEQPSVEPYEPAPRQLDASLN